MNKNQVYFQIFNDTIKDVSPELEVVYYSMKTFDSGDFLRAVATFNRELSRIEKIKWLGRLDDMGFFGNVEVDNRAFGKSVCFFNSEIYLTVDLVDNVYQFKRFAQ